MEAFGEWGEVGLPPRALADAEGLVEEEPRRRRLSPALTVASASSASSSSSLPGPLPRPPPLMDKPPGRLLAGAVGEDMFIWPEERDMGAPTGIAEGSVPWGALRHAWMRFFPSG
jgi:hypothetical protein